MVNWPILSLTSFALLLLSTLLLTTGWSSYFLFAAPLLVTSVLLLSTSLYLESDTYYRDTHKDRPFTKKEILSLLGIVCIGMILRLQDLHIFPYPYGVLSIEEAQGGSLSSKVYEGTSYPWEFIVEYCLGALGMSIWGHDNLFSIRFAFATFNGLMPIAFHILARQLVSPLVAFFCSGLLAVSHWELYYARHGHTSFPPVFWVLILFSACVYLWRCSAIFVSPVIGFLTGYTLFCYAGYRGVPIFVSLFLIYNGYLIYRRGNKLEFRDYKISIGIAFFVFLCMVSILLGRIGSDYRHFYESISRSYANVEYFPEVWSDWFSLRFIRMKQALGIFSITGDTEVGYNLPKEPMLDVITAMLFYISLVYCFIKKLRFPYGFFMSFYWVTFFLGLVLLTHSFVVCRISVTVPFLFLIISFAIDEFHKKFQKFSRYVLSFLLVCVFVLNYNIYEREKNGSEAKYFMTSNIYLNIIEQMNLLGKDKEFYILSDADNLCSGSDFSWMVKEYKCNNIKSLSEIPNKLRKQRFYIIMQGAYNKKEIYNQIEYEFSTKCVKIPHDYPALSPSICVVEPYHE